MDRRFRCKRLLAGGALLCMGSVFAGQAAAQFTEADGLQINIEGCRQATANTIAFPAPSPNGSPTGFVCDEGIGTGGTEEGAYIEGNIKFWNELDLVPYHANLTLAGTSTTPTYNLTIIGDAEVDVQGTAVPGYDAISAPTVNSSTAANCTVSDTGIQEIKDPAVSGGAAKSIVRTIEITQTPGTVCTIDWTKRLAVGSSGFQGASLQARVANQDDFGGGDRTITIFLKDVLPQELRKDMAAQQDTDYAWNLTKVATPANLSFRNTCDATEPTSKAVSVRLEWEIFPGADGMVMVVTNIYATNPASRAVTVEVTDEIYGDPDGAAGPELKQSLDVASSDPSVVPGNTEVLLLTHTFDAPAAVTELMDVATATYIDTLTGVPIDQTTEAVFDLDTDGMPPGIQPGTETNTTATVTDTESLSGNGLQYSADSTVVSSADGSFTVNGAPYTLGTKLDKDSFDLLWTSVTQDGILNCADPNGCPVGFVEINKTVYVDPVPAITSGTLSDTATLNASDDFQKSVGPVNINISSNALVELTLVKTIPDILQGAETITCNFTVTDSQNNEVATPSFEFTAGEVQEQTTIGGLAPDTYTVVEGACGGLTPAGGTTQMVNLNLPTCADTVTFDNIVGEGSAVAEVNKVTIPTGFENDWVMTLSGPGTNGGITLTTADFDPAAFERFIDPGTGTDFQLLEGTYTITEMVKDGWENTASSGCEFTINYPENFGALKQCTYTNKKLGKIVINKVTDPAGGTGFGFTDDIEAPNEFTLDDGGTKTFLDVPAGQYTVTENDPQPEYDLVGLVCTDDPGQFGYNVDDSSTDLVNREATINLDPGETVECTYTNRQRGMVDLLKLTNGAQDPNMGWSFTLTGPDVNVGDSTPPPLVDFNMAKLIPGETYTMCETGIPPSWTVQWALDENGNGVIDDGETLPFLGGSTGNLLEVYDPTFGQPGATNDTRCVDFQTSAGETVHFIIDNQRPGGEPRTPGYWKNWNTCTGGNQVQTAANNGGVAEGWFLLDDLIPTTVGNLTIDSCETGVSVLDRRELNPRNRKKASDAAYNLASHLLAAKLNLAAGAETCDAVVDAVVAGDALLSSIGFDGIGNFLRPKDADYGPALDLAGNLDAYNNGELCP